MTLADQESLHRLCVNNRALLETSDLAGCFYCEEILRPREITDWIDGRQIETGDTADGVTALCPRCGIDAVLPGSAPITLTVSLLREMNKHWF